MKVIGEKRKEELGSVHLMASSSLNWGWNTEISKIRILSARLAADSTVCLTHITLILTVTPKKV